MCWIRWKLLYSLWSFWENRESLTPLPSSWPLVMVYQTSCKAGIILFPTCTLVTSFWLPVPKSEREKKRRPELLQGVKDDTWLSWGVSLHALRTQAWLSSLSDGIEELLGRGSSLRSKKVCICKIALVLLCSSFKSIFSFRWVTDLSGT